ncbi:uncharacterized protein EV420DRAFT_1752241 [Desarmillaria tabescens]|uniref:Uncharacterized protein n=1 Tax=Armillaria tabescens TaxID=1929756 RepID=A0AA39MQN1_ARMTA|nr:uncharacterized protein EV420DRAFT_1752241 [Desarmillaria tabescens]KAK0442698.1 hypothetical protein EV420DRAFT_1752241 [Desarmillaria tabescens]
MCMISPARSIRSTSCLQTDSSVVPLASKRVLLLPAIDDAAHHFSILLTATSQTGSHSPIVINVGRRGPSSYNRRSNARFSSGTSSEAFTSGPKRQLFFSRINTFWTASSTILRVVTKMTRIGSNARTPPVDQLKVTGLFATPVAAVLDEGKTGYVTYISRFPYTTYPFPFTTTSSVTTTSHTTFLYVSPTPTTPLANSRRWLSASYPGPWVTHTSYFHVALSSAFNPNKIATHQTASSMLSVSIAQPSRGLKGPAAAVADGALLLRPQMESFAKDIACAVVTSTDGILSERSHLCSGTRLLRPQVVSFAKDLTCAVVLGGYVRWWCPSRRMSPVWWYSSVVLCFLVDDSYALIAADLPYTSCHSAWFAMSGLWTRPFLIGTWRRFFPADSDYTVAPQSYSFSDPYGSANLVIGFEVVFEDKPVFFLQIKEPQALAVKSAREEADGQMRKCMRDLAPNCLLGILYGISAFGTRLCFYSYDKQTRILPKRVSPDRERETDIAPLNRWTATSCKMKEANDSKILSQRSRRNANDFERGGDSVCRTY